jgi:hypothetical protein
MKHTSLIARLLVVALSLATRTAWAQESPAEAATSAPATTNSAPSSNESAEWGWLIIGSSVALGAALTVTGLAEECRGDRDCRVAQSQLIWGGIGLASTGSMIGFMLIENARDSDRRPPTAWTLTVQGSL